MILAALLRILLLPLRILLAPLIILIRILLIILRLLLRFLLFFINPVVLIGGPLQVLNILAQIARMILMIIARILERLREEIEKDEHEEIEVVTIDERLAHHKEPKHRHHHHPRKRKISKRNDRQARVLMEDLGEVLLAGGRLMKKIDLLRLSFQSRWDCSLKWATHQLPVAASQGPCSYLDSLAMSQMKLS